MVSLTKYEKEKLKEILTKSKDKDSKKILDKINSKKNWGMLVGERKFENY